MVGSGLKKYAKEHNLKVDGGMVYGELKGYNVTMHEGSGWKLLSVNTKFLDPEQRRAFETALSNANASAEYRIKDISKADDHISFVFTDSVGTMKRIEAFVDWLMPLLAQHGATGADVCTCCGCSMNGQGKWVLIGDVAVHMHDACIRSTSEQIRGSEAQVREADTGKYLSGFIGALLGALIGSIAFAGLLYVGYIASIAGFLIGFLAEKGYRLLKGKAGKGKLVILIVAVIIGVAVGTVCGEFAALLKVLAEEGVPSDYLIDSLKSLIETTPDVREAIISDITSNGLLGLLFAALGVFGIMRQTVRETSGTRIKELK